MVKGGSFELMVLTQKMKKKGTTLEAPISYNRHQVLIRRLMHNGRHTRLRLLRRRRSFQRRPHRRCHRHHGPHRFHSVSEHGSGSERVTNL